MSEFHKGLFLSLTGSGAGKTGLKAGKADIRTKRAEGAGLGVG